MERIRATIPLKELVWDLGTLIIIYIVLTFVLQLIYSTNELFCSNGTS